MAALRATIFKTNINVIMHSNIILYARNDISFWKDKFIKQRDSAKSLEEKKNYARCLSLLKWAEHCNANLESVSCTTMNSVDFTFLFKDIDDLNEFVNNLNESVTDEII